MGFNQTSVSTFATVCNTSKVSKTDLLGAVLAGFGIWTKTTQPVKTAQQNLLPASVVPSKTSNNVYPLRVTRVKDVNPQLAGRMVISGRMADVCAELDRLAA